MSFLPKLLIGIKVSVMWVLKLFTILIALELLVVAGQKESKIHIPRMNRLYHRWTALFFAAVFCSCGGNSNKKDVLSSATVVFRGADSLAVEGVLLADSSKLVLPLVYAYPDNETSEYDSVGKSIDELNLKKTGYLVVTTPLCGYNVTATIYDAEENNFLDIIEYHLKKSGQEFVIKTTYDSRYFPIPDENSNAPDGLPIYTVHNDCSFVQDDKSEFESTLFCFKDVDFDGEKEFCCVLPGYNRHYFSAYKLLLGKALLMCGAPYNNLVVGDYDVSAKTIFDYDAKTISISEQFGVTGFSENVFILNEGTGNALSPMKRETGRHIEYGCWGSLESIYQDNLLSEETQEYYLIDGNQNIAAHYVVDSLSTFHLASIVFFDNKRAYSKILWDKKRFSGNRLCYLVSSHVYDPVDVISAGSFLYIENIRQQIMPIFVIKDQNMPIRHTEKETADKVMAALKNPSRLFKSSVINWAGTTIDTDVPYVEVISKILLDRKEEIVGMILFNQKTVSPDYGEVLDYQIPLKANGRDKVGFKAFDLLSYDKVRNTAWILELKVSDNKNDSLLHSVLEAYTYLKTVHREKLLDDFSLNTSAELKAAVLSIEGDRRHREYKALDSMPFLKQLISRLMIEVFFLSREPAF